MLPVCKALGYDLVAFGIVATVNLAIGQVTPPVGVNLFVAISVKIKKGLEVTLQEISKAVLPMIAACVVVLLMVTYIPQISTCLPKLFAGSSYTGTSKILRQKRASLMMTIIRLMITVTLAGKNRPGTLHALPQKPVPGHRLENSLEN